MKDDYSKKSVDMGQFESRDGRHAKGFYYVFLLDGRTPSDRRLRGWRQSTKKKSDRCCIRKKPSPSTKEEILRPVYKEEIRSSYQPAEILKPINYNKKIKPIYRELIVEPVYGTNPLEEIVSVYQEDIRGY